MKVLTLATEDSKYGVQLQAEPDSERLGKRLKGDFKRVAPAIKALSNEQLVAFQNEGTIEVEGHELTVEDIKVWQSDIQYVLIDIVWSGSLVCSISALMSWMAPCTLQEVFKVCEIAVVFNRRYRMRSQSLCLLVTMPTRVGPSSFCWTRLPPRRWWMREWHGKSSTRFRNSEKRSSSLLYSFFTATGFS